MDYNTCMSKESELNKTALLQEDIDYYIKKAGLVGYSGSYTELGGGELNDTYVLHGDAEDVVLRISKYPGRSALRREDQALQLLQHVPCVPKLVYFDSNDQHRGKTWIVETLQPGQHKKRLSVQQFRSLGRLLANVHQVQIDTACSSPWSVVISNCDRFGDEEYLLNHPDERLRHYFHSIKEESARFDVRLKKQCLRHCDITPGNTLVHVTDVALIDWELSGFGDPMTDFSTGYWSDIELNNGRWRQKLSDGEREALYQGYTENGGVIDEQLVLFYEILDKAAAASYLYWRLYTSDWQKDDSAERQYKLDYEKIIESLNRALT